MSLEPEIITDGVIGVHLVLLVNLIEAEPFLLGFAVFDISLSYSTGITVLLSGEDDFHGDVVGIGANFKDEVCFFLSSAAEDVFFGLSLRFCDDIFEFTL